MWMMRERFGFDPEGWGGGGKGGVGKGTPNLSRIIHMYSWPLTDGKIGNYICRLRRLSVYKNHFLIPIPSYCVMDPIIIKIPREISMAVL